MATQNLGRVGLVLKGEWDSATAYTALDVVSHDGNAWAAKQNSTNVEPTTANSDFWQLFSNNADLVATVQGLKEDAANSATAAAASAADAEASAQYGEDAFNAIAHTFDPGVDYTAGKYVWYNGELYRFNVNHPAGSWIGTDAARYTATDELPLIQQALGTKADAADVADLKSALTSNKSLTFEVGTLSGGKSAAHTKYARTAAFYEITKGAPIVFSGSTKLLRCVVYFYNSANENDVLQTIDQFDIPVGGHYTVTAPEDCYFKFRVTWIPQSDITSSDLTLFAQLFNYYIPESYARIGNLQEELTAEQITNASQQKQLDSAIPIIQMDDLEIGGISQGNNNTDNRYVRCATYYPVNKGETIQIKSSSEFNYNYAFYIYSQDGGDSSSIITISQDSFISKNGQDGSYIVPATGYIRFRAVTVPAAAVTTERLNAFKALMSYQKYNFLGVVNDAIADKTRNYNVISINHRGFSTAPENTLLAFKQSKIHGFDYVETDVRFTSDGVAVLLHDASINRTARNADGTAISGTVNIADITYEQALTYDFGIYKGSEYAGTKIPKYEDFLALCRNISLIPCIELKAGTREQVYALYDLAAQYGLKNKAIWLSQTFTYLAYIRDYSDATLVYCRSTYTPDTQYLKNDGNKVIAGLPSAGITAETVSACIAAGYEIWQYTVEIASDISANQYVTGYLTNTIDVGETLYNQAMN